MKRATRRGGEAEATLRNPYVPLLRGTLVATRILFVTVRAGGGEQGALAGEMSSGEKRFH